MKVERGSAPDAGFAEAGTPSVSPKFHSGSRIAIAKERVREIVALAKHLGQPPRIEDVFSLLAIRLKDLVPHESMAVYCPSNDTLVPRFVSGENMRLFSSLKIPLGEGLSGWVAQNHKAILNGNPSVEPGYLNDPTKYSTLRSALAVPVENSSRVLAVLALYRAGHDAFTNEDLQILETMSSELGGILAMPQAATAAAGAN